MLVAAGRKTLWIFLLTCSISRLWAPCALADTASRQDRRWTLGNAPERGDTIRARVVLELAGHLLPDPVSKEPNGATDNERRVSVRGEGELVYSERCVSQESPQRVARYYDHAEAKLEVSQHQQDVRLRDQRRLVVVEPGAGSMGLVSPLGPLTRAELDLLTVPAGSHVIHQLLPAKEVGEGDSWPHDSEAAAVLFNLDRVTETDLVSKVSSAEGDELRIELTGRVRGTADGAATDLEVQGKYTCDAALGRITWVALAIHEQRSLSQAAPGFDLVARVRMRIATAPSVPDQLADSNLGALAASSDAAPQLLEYLAPSGVFRVLHDRHWYVHRERHNLTVMRRVDPDGQQIAQCNLSTLPTQPGRTEVTIDRYQQQVQQALGEYFESFLEASAQTAPGDVRVLRAVATGRVAATPIRWIYYHVSDPAGHAVSCVFTMKDDAIERFAAADVTMMDSLTFLSPNEVAPDEPLTRHAQAEPAGQESPSE